MTFKEKIERLIEKEGISKNEFCKRTGISMPALTSWLYKDAMPTLYTAIKIAQAFNISLDYFRDDLVPNTDSAFRKAMSIIDKFYDKWTYAQKVKLVKNIL